MGLANVLHQQISSELHLHTGGAYHLEDVLALGQDTFREVAWHSRDYLTEYERVFGISADPIAAFEAALQGDSSLLHQLHVYGDTDSGDFEHFVWKYRFFAQMWVHFWEQRADGPARLVQQIVKRQRQEGLRYVEHRAGFWGEPEQRFKWLYQLITLLQEATADFMEIGLIVPLPREEPWTSYNVIRQLQQQYPDETRSLVGVDFVYYEEGLPPKILRPFLHQLHLDNQQNPAQALDAVYHVGESYFDKSLESSVRWCHEVAEMGVKRLGHAIALGLDPAVAVTRRPQAHEAELVTERLDQIAYDLRHQQALRRYGVDVDVTALEAEQTALTKLAEDAMVKRPYSPHRFAEIRHRQQFVLDDLTARGCVIESCPTSNRRIGGIEKPEHHPIFRFLESEVPLVICADDPGTLDITLAEEVAWVVQHGPLDAEGLAKRLGDPYRFRLGQGRG